MYTNNCPGTELKLSFRIQKRGNRRDPGQDFVYKNVGVTLRIGCAQFKSMYTFLEIGGVNPVQGISEAIERMRRELNDLAKARGISDPLVLEKSQELDCLITEHTKQQLKGGVKGDRNTDS